jgi:hypothetical protein
MPETGSGEYCGTSVTVDYSLSWNESVTLSPFSFTLATHVLSDPTAASGSVTFSSTISYPATVNGATSCPADTATTTGSFAGSSTTTVTGMTVTNEPYLALADSPAGSGPGWAGSITGTDPAINGGKPQTADDSWYPHIGIDILIGKNDTGTLSGDLPTSQSLYQQSDEAYDEFANGFSITPHAFGLAGAAQASVQGPSTAPPKAPPKAPPVTKITHHPKSKTTSRKATFKFTSSEKGSTFRCSIDKAKAKPCKSPTTYKKLKPGKKTFSVTAVGPDGKKDPTPAHWSWKIKT